MLANFLNKSKPINFVVLLLFFIVNFAVVFITNKFSSSFDLYPLVFMGILLLLFVGIFFFYNFIISKNKLTYDNSFAYFSYNLLVISMLFDILDIKSLTVILLYILFLRKVYSLRSYKNTIKKYFDAGMWLGILFLFDAVSIVFCLLLYLAVYLYQKLTINALLVPLFGFLTPIILYGTYLFWNDNIDFLSELINIQFQFTLVNLKQIWFVVSVFVITTLSLFFKSIRTIGVNNMFRKSWLLLSFNFFIGIFCLYITTNSNSTKLVYMLFPASIIIANGIELVKKSLFRNLVLLLLLFLSLFYLYFT